MPRKLIDYTQRGRKLKPPELEAGCSMRSIHPCFEGEQFDGPAARRRHSNCSAISEISYDVPTVLDLSFADLGLTDDANTIEEEPVDFMMKVPYRQQGKQQQQEEVSRQSSQKSLRDMFSRQRSNKTKQPSILQSILGDLISNESKSKRRFS